MFGVILLAYLSYRNGILAKSKSENVYIWALYTVIAYILGSSLGIFVVLIYFSKGIMSVEQLANIDPRVGAAQLQQVFQDNPLDYVTMVLFGVGGYLLIRYLLERKPGKDKPNVNWMDKLGGGSN